ncbi:MAG: hypothetical protein SVK08_01840 [Halobacteriota archaeon]|nr:hypothetical protein [Halobacteriota archaeon]
MEQLVQFLGELREILMKVISHLESAGQEQQTAKTAELLREIGVDEDQVNSILEKVAGSENSLEAITELMNVLGVEREEIAIGKVASDENTNGDIPRSQQTWSDFVNG